MRGAAPGHLPGGSPAAASGPRLESRSRVSGMFRRLSSVPDWLLGLVLAIGVTLVLYFVFGAGDDPTLAGG
jgi:hypothetical protein